MKKRLLIISLVTLISVTSCNVMSKNNIDSIPRAKVKVNSTEFEKQTSLSLVTKAFKSVLLNEKMFSFTNKTLYCEESRTEKFNGYIKEFEQLNESEYKIIEFSVVDLDGDGISEIVLYSYSKKQIEQELVDQLVLKKEAEYSKQENLCQDYLDSIAYLIDLSASDKREYKSYYVACNKEMKKIYQLCLGKLRGKEVFEANALTSTTSLVFK